MACRLLGETVAEFMNNGIAEFVGGSGGWAPAPGYVASAANTYGAAVLLGCPAGKQPPGAG